ncbi:UNKNOWN [Stylonychia lemnae]|uniref:Uncharacterized protein n=1 Tax=Stylonychia lemnae TaxID=5949 RepID=A0A078ARZ1_STYLE|nr:UNKNOWN [Stylonychia lemnae]|eukprot:CDW85250.1 UNKNOWN [Stylonychia lemnae]
MIILIDVINKKVVDTIWCISLKLVQLENSQLYCLVSLKNFAIMIKKILVEGQTEVLQEEKIFQTNSLVVQFEQSKDLIYALTENGTLYRAQIQSMEFQEIYRIQQADNNQIQYLNFQIQEQNIFYFGTNIGIVYQLDLAKNYFDKVYLGDSKISDINISQQPLKVPFLDEDVDKLTQPKDMQNTIRAFRLKSLRIEFQPQDMIESFQYLRCSLMAGSAKISAIFIPYNKSVQKLLGWKLNTGLENIETFEVQDYTSKNVFRGREITSFALSQGFQGGLCAIVFEHNQLILYHTASKEVVKKICLPGKSSIVSLVFIDNYQQIRGQSLKHLNKEIQMILEMQEKAPILIIITDSGCLYLANVIDDKKTLVLQLEIISKSYDLHIPNQVLLSKEIKQNIDVTEINNQIVEDGELPDDYEQNNNQTESASHFQKNQKYLLLKESEQIFYVIDRHLLRQFVISQNHQTYINLQKALEGIQQDNSRKVVTTQWVYHDSNAFITSSDDKQLMVWNLNEVIQGCSTKIIQNNQSIQQNQKVKDNHQSSNLQNKRKQKTNEKLQQANKRHLNDQNNGQQHSNLLQLEQKKEFTLFSVIQGRVIYQQKKDVTQQITDLLKDGLIQLDGNIFEQYVDFRLFRFDEQKNVNDAQYIIEQELQSCLYIQRFEFFQKLVMLKAWLYLFHNEDEIRQIRYEELKKSFYENYYKLQGDQKDCNFNMAFELFIKEIQKQDALDFKSIKYNCQNFHLLRLIQIIEDQCLPVAIKAFKEKGLLIECLVIAKLLNNREAFKLSLEYLKEQQKERPAQVLKIEAALNLLNQQLIQEPQLQHQMI